MDLSHTYLLTPKFVNLEIFNREPEVWFFTPGDFTIFIQIVLTFSMGQRVQLFWFIIGWPLQLQHLYTRRK